MTTSSVETIDEESTEGADMRRRVAEIQRRLAENIRRRMGKSLIIQKEKSKSSVRPPEEATPGDSIVLSEASEAASRTLKKTRTKPRSTRNRDLRPLRAEEAKLVERRRPRVVRFDPVDSPTQINPQEVLANAKPRVLRLRTGAHQVRDSRLLCLCSSREAFRRRSPGNSTTRSTRLTNTHHISS